MARVSDEEITAILHEEELFAYADGCTSQTEKLCLDLRDAREALKVAHAWLVKSRAGTLTEEDPTIEGLIARLEGICHG